MFKTQTNHFLQISFSIIDMFFLFPVYLHFQGICPEFCEQTNFEEIYPLIIQTSKAGAEVI